MSSRYKIQRVTTREESDCVEECAKKWFEDFAGDLHDHLVQSLREIDGTEPQNSTETRIYYAHGRMNKTPVGYVSIELRNYETVVSLICVNPLWRNRGIGSILLQTVENLSASRNVPVTLSALMDVKNVASFYLKRGYEPCLQNHSVRRDYRRVSRTIRKMSSLDWENWRNRSKERNVFCLSKEFSVQV